MQANNGGEVTHFVIHADTIYRKHCTRGRSFDFFWGGGAPARGVGRFQKKISCNPRRKKEKIMQHTIEKKISCKRERSKKIPACKSTEAFHFSIHRLARFCIFEQLAHLLKRTLGEQWTTSQGFYCLWSL